MTEQLVELGMPDDTYSIDQAQAVLTASSAIVLGDIERGVRATLVAHLRPRHREHTQALLAVVDELAERTFLPAREVPWILLAGTDTPEIVFEVVRRAPRGKWLWMRSSHWCKYVSEAIRVMLVAYCDDVDPGACDVSAEAWSDNSVAAVIGAARMRLYERAGQ